MSMSTGWPTRMSDSCVSLKLAVTHTPVSATTVSSGWPACTSWPTSTCLRDTSPAMGAVTCVYESWSLALSTAACAAASRACASRTPACARDVGRRRALLLLQRFERGRRRVGRRLGAVELLPGHDLLGHQFPGARQVGVGLGQVRLRGDDLRVERRPLVGRGLHRGLRLPLTLRAGHGGPRRGQVGFGLREPGPVLGRVDLHEQRIDAATCWFSSTVIFCT